MRYTLYYDYYHTDGTQVSIVVDENFEDIFAWYFTNKYDTKYNSHNWFLEKDSWDFYHQIENKWLRNEIDTWELYHDIDFKKFLHNLYEDEARKIYYNDLSENYGDLYENEYE